MLKKIIECKTEDEALKIIEEIYKYAYEHGWDNCKDLKGATDYFYSLMDNSYLHYIRE